MYISLVLDRMFFKSMWFSMLFIILFNMMINGIVSLVSLSELFLLVHKNARNFCVLIVYPATLTVSLMSTDRSFLSSGFSIYIYRLICKLWQFYFFFPIWISFIVFYSLISMGKTSKTMLNNSARVDTPSRAFFIFVTVVLICSIFLWFFLRIFTSSAYVAHLFLHVVYCIH